MRSVVGVCAATGTSTRTWRLCRLRLARFCLWCCIADTATSFGTGTRQSWDVRFPKYTIGVTSIGVRIHSNVDKPVSVGLSLLAGADWDLLYEKISPTLSKRTLYLHGSLDGKLQINFLLNPQTSLGIFYDYSFKYPFSRAVSVSDLPNIHTAGIVFGYKFKRKAE